jgi:hypothetical protein
MTTGKTTISFQEHRGKAMKFNSKTIISFIIINQSSNYITMIIDDNNDDDSNVNGIKSIIMIIIMMTIGGEPEFALRFNRQCWGLVLFYKIIMISLLCVSDESYS